MNNYFLGDLLKIKNGRDHKHLEDGKIPVFGSGGFMRYVNQSLYDDESILLPRKGSLSNIQYTKKPFWTVDTLYYTEIDKKKVEPYYLYHYLKRLDLSNLNSGTGVPSMTFRAYYDIKIKLPDLPTQQKIASVLSALDDKIELNNRINAELEAMAKTLYDYWFVQFDFPIVTSSGVEKPYKTSGGKMVYNETLKREIPEGWEVKTIGDYCKSTGGFAFKSSWWTDNGMPVVKIKDIQEDYTINLSDLAFVDISDKNIDDKFKAKPGDVLIAMTGATVGKYAIVPYTEKPLYVNQRVGYFNLGIKPEKKLPFLINSLNQKYFRESVFTLASGAAQPNISNEQINNIQLLLPSKEIIELYNKVFEPYYSKILLNQKQNQELSALRDWLLPMLMNGQVKVG
ncbi:restriction endonuclease subunit S [Elizabethkingia sp. M8]|uniref:restriction endonuclease subunit S n=1 Tax=Elizabethkingia sp. M8 TaxID=2796140 RepID=UPI001906A608|nr:restriction endonuclease subunit S [Elizabethkingia sp. M8]QQM26253.1 restriction endonuclease subunit S [Elizabethkingia sp. M8]